MRDEHQAMIGAQIGILREQQGWSQRALAKWVGLDQSAVSRIEAGHRRLSADELQRFADALHVSADALLKGGLEPAGGASAEAPPSVPFFASGEPRLRMASSELRQESRMTPGPDLSASQGEPRREASSDPQRLLEMSPARRASAPMDFDRIAAAIPAEQASSPRGLPRVAGLLRVTGLPDAVAGVARDWFTLRRLSQGEEPAQIWSTGHSAEGRPERLPHSAASLRPGPAAGDVLFDRVARFWRSELHLAPDDGPLPDLVPLLEDAYGAQVVVARVENSAGRAQAAASLHPVAAAFAAGGIPFIFVNAARPVVLQRFALAHAFAHLVLGHGDVVDHHIEWSRHVPPEAAANDFAEEFLAPVRAVQRWYERRDVPRRVRLEDLLDLGNAFGISAWAALYRSRAAGRLQGKQFHMLRAEMQRKECELLPRQAYLGGLRDTLAHLTPDEALPAGAYGVPAVLRVPAAMRAWTLEVVQSGRLSIDEAAAMLRLAPAVLAEQLTLLGLE